MRKILWVKRAKRTRFSPKKAKPGAFWVLERIGTVGDGYNQMRKPSVRTNVNHITMQHKKTGENPVFSPVLWQGQKDLNPRHAVLEWMGGTQPEAGEARWCPFSHTSPKPGGAGLVLWGNFAVAVAVKLPQIQSSSPPGSAGCPQRTAVPFPPGPRPASQKTPGWRR